MTKKIIRGAVLTAVLAPLSLVAGCGGLSTTLHLSFLDPHGIDVSKQVTHDGPKDGATLTSGNLYTITITSDQMIKDVSYDNALQYGDVDARHKSFSFVAGEDSSGVPNSHDTSVTVNLSQIGLHGFLISFIDPSGKDITSQMTWEGPKNYDQLVASTQYNIQITSAQTIKDIAFAGAHPVGMQQPKQFSFVAERTDPKITVNVLLPPKPLESAGKSLP
jgi:hypothetical protein